MKKIIIIVIVLFFAFGVGCKSLDYQNENQLFTSSAVESSINKTANTQLLKIYLLADLLRGNNLTVNQIVAWEKYIKEEFNIEIKLEMIKGDLESSVFKFQENYNNEGIVFLGNPSRLKDYQKNGDIAPIPETIMSALKELYPNDAFDKVTFSGEIYGIPASYNQFSNIRRRILRKDWLANLNIDEPKTIAALHDAFYLFRYGDPDGNGADDTFGALSYNMNGVHDIFEAYGLNIAIPGYNTIAPINFNFNSMQYEDFFLGDNFIDCMAFIKQCYDEGIITFVEDYSEYKQLFDTSYGSYLFNNSASYKVYSSYINDYIDTYSYSHHNYQGKVYYDSYGLYYGVLSNTQNIEEVVSTFIDTFYLNYKGFLAGRFGEPGTDAKDGAYWFENGSLHTDMSSYIGIVFNSRIFYDYAKYFTDISDDTPNSSTTHKDNEFNNYLRNQIINRYETIYYDESILNELFWRNFEKTWGTFDELINTALLEVVKGEQTIEEFLLYYSTLKEEYGLSNAVKELNEYYMSND